jgi:predicted RNA-binding Zn-ribbon protein involved in translation (DUF1610 family)
MAFGRERSSNGAGAPSWRQRSAHFGAPPRRTTRSGPPHFIDTYTPPIGTRDTIRLVMGHHARIVVQGEEPALFEVPATFEYWRYDEHFDAWTNRSAICSAGPYAHFRDRRKPCAGCDKYWATAEPDVDGKRRSPCMSRRTKFAFSMIDYGRYHKLPQLDVDGRSKVNPRSGKPYLDWIKCEGVGCRACLDNRIETKMGHNPHWSMSYGHFQSLRAADRQIGETCATCGRNKAIESVAWVCRQCGEAAVEMRRTTLKMEEIVALTEAEYACRDCGNVALLEEIVRCAECNDRARRATIFDVDIDVWRVETGQNKQTLLYAVASSAPGPVAKELEVLAKPKDLARIFAPDPYHRQCERFDWKTESLPHGPPQASGVQQT